MLGILRHILARGRDAAQLTFATLVLLVGLAAPAYAGPPPCIDAPPIPMPVIVIVTAGGIGSAPLSLTQVVVDLAKDKAKDAIREKVQGLVDSGITDVGVRSEKNASGGCDFNFSIYGSGTVANFKVTTTPATQSWLQLNVSGGSSWSGQVSDVTFGEGVNQETVFTTVYGTIGK